jgi:pimeloyl-ACP methyl ester carboxylesterase
VILIGHSMGGPVSLAAAPRLSGTLVGIVGVDTLHNAEYEWPEGEANGFLGGLKADFKGTMRAGLKGLLRSDVDPELLESLTAGAESQDPTMAVGLMTDMTKLDEAKLMSAAKVPIRCINSAPTFQFSLPTQIETNKKYADFDAVIMDGVGHYPMLEKPEEFNTRLSEVLKQFAAK